MPPFAQMFCYLGFRSLPLELFTEQETRAPPWDPVTTLATEKPTRSSSFSRNKVTHKYQTLKYDSRHLFAVNLFTLIWLLSSMCMSEILRQLPLELSTEQDPLVPTLATEKPIRSSCFSKNKVHRTIHIYENFNFVWNILFTASSNVIFITTLLAFCRWIQ